MLCIFRGTCRIRAPGMAVDRLTLSGGARGEEVGTYNQEKSFLSGQTCETLPLLSRNTIIGLLQHF